MVCYEHLDIIRTILPLVLVLTELVKSINVSPALELDEDILFVHIDHFMK
jgi:hypothetical protein